MRCAFMRAAAQWFFYHVIRTKFPSAEYVDFNDVHKWKSNPQHTVQCYDPTDFELEDELRKTIPRIEFLEHTDAFMLSKANLASFGAKVRSNAEFFKRAKRFFAIDKDLPDSTDQENRRPLPAAMASKIPAMPSYSKSDGELRRYYEEAIKYTQTHFKTHHGMCDMADFLKLPITHNDAQQHMKTFVSKRLMQFGTYQDAIAKDHVVLFHAHISYLLNCGLLSPKDVLVEMKRLLNKSKTAKIPMNSLEGFIRQLLGWREYMRYLYITHGRAWKRLVSTKNKNNVLPQAWYQGTTGLEPIDAEIKKGVRYGWAHHIVRLMVFLSPLRMMHASPAAVYRWFMEVISLDAYEWVMITNILTMGYYVKGFTHKPYYSSSHYILKMSDYPKSPQWIEVMDALFYSAIQGEPAYQRNLHAWKAKPASERKRLEGIAKKHQLAP